MSALQSTLPFCVRKSSKFDFYSKKHDTPKESSPTRTQTDEVLKEKNAPKEVAAVRKIVELDSGDENINLTNIKASVRKGLKRKYVKHKQCDDESSDDSECSPKKRIILLPKKNSTKNSFKCNVISNLTDQIDEKLNNVQNKNTQTLPGRNAELVKLTKYLEDHLEKQSSGTLYISGPPGTGKTACLTNILENEKIKKEYKEVYINCTTMKSAGSIYNRICQELHIKSSSHTEKSYLKAIEKHLAGNHSMVLLVLDEIDQLCNKKQSVLYTIFEWPSRPNSKIVIIGIANALDLTDRVLPRLKANCNMQPDLMHFAPYSKQQIIEIFTEKLKNEMNNDLFSPVAIQMLAGKVAAVSGDVRRALDIGRRVVELASPRGVHKKPEARNAVELKQVMSVLNDVYGASQNLNVDVDDNFPLQQKILICSLLLILNKGKNKDVSVGKLHDVYKRVCSKRNIIAVDSTEFFGLCSLLETRGIIKLGGKTSSRQQKIILQWDESEVRDAFSDKQMISDILNDVFCL